MLRRSIFAERDTFIKEWNAKEGQTHQVGHNEFSDWTEHELNRLRGVRIPANHDQIEAVKLDDSNLAASIDWRAKGALNPVGNQKVCMAGWAFSAVAAMEAAHFLKTGTLLKLSEQQCVDCAT